MKNTKATRTAAAIVAILAVAGPVTNAEAKDAKAHKYTSSVTSTQLSTANGYPGQGGTAVLVGTIDTNQFGAGALVDRVTITGNPQPNVIKFKGTEVEFFLDGTQRNKFTGTDTIAEDGSQHLVVTGEFTGGTGRYRHAKGTYKFTGSSAPGASVVNGASHGKVSY